MTSFGRMVDGKVAGFSALVLLKAFVYRKLNRKFNVIFRSFDLIGIRLFK